MGKRRVEVEKWGGQADEARLGRRATESLQVAGPKAARLGELAGPQATGPGGRGEGELGPGAGEVEARRRGGRRGAKPGRPPAHQLLLDEGPEKVGALACRAEEGGNLDEQGW